MRAPRQLAIVAAGASAAPSASDIAWPYLERAAMAVERAHDTTQEAM
ncbi:hypothetical protein [Mycolicibacterium rutilum]|nr:hypothetical protein [Mycolicibacterium rutilum]